MVHTLKYIYSAIYGLLKLHGFMLDARFPKGEGVSAVPAYLVFCLASHHSWIFGGMSFLPAVPCTYLYVAICFSLDAPMCNYTDFCFCGGHMAHVCM